MRRRVLIDIEFAVDEEKFKVAQLPDDATGVSDITDASVREAVAIRVLRADWAAQGLQPQRSTVTTRASATNGGFPAVVVPADAGVADS